MINDRINDRCAHCPVAPRIACHGQRAPRLCQLIDPAHPDYQPAYRDSIVQISRPPSRFRRAIHFARSMGRWFTAGLKTVSDTEQTRRLAICRACPEFDAEPGRCRQCGCIGRWKTRLATEHCPLDPPKW
jgi:hypothetical protein